MNNKKSLTEIPVRDDHIAVPLCFRASAKRHMHRHLDPLTRETCFHTQKLFRKQAYECTSSLFLQGLLSAGDNPSLMLSQKLLYPLNAFILSLLEYAKSPGLSTVVLYIHIIFSPIQSKTMVLIIIKIMAPSTFHLRVRLSLTKCSLRSCSSSFSSSLLAAICFCRSSSAFFSHSFIRASQSLYPSKASRLSFTLS